MNSLLKQFLMLLVIASIATATKIENESIDLPTEKKFLRIVGNDTGNAKDCVAYFNKTVETQFGYLSKTFINATDMITAGVNYRFKAVYNLTKGSNLTFDAYVQYKPATKTYEIQQVSNGDYSTLNAFITIASEQLPAATKDWAQAYLQNQTNLTKTDLVKLNDPIQRQLNDYEKSPARQEFLYRLNFTYKTGATVNTNFVVLVGEYLKNKTTWVFAYNTSLCPSNELYDVVSKKCQKTCNGFKNQYSNTCQKQCSKEQYADQNEKECVMPCSQDASSLRNPKCIDKCNIIIFEGVNNDLNVSYSKYGCGVKTNMSADPNQGLQNFSSLINNNYQNLDNVNYTEVLTTFKDFMADLKTNKNFGKVHASSILNSFDVIKKYPQFRNSKNQSFNYTADEFQLQREVQAAMIALFISNQSKTGSAQAASNYSSFAIYNMTETANVSNVTTQTSKGQNCQAKVSYKGQVSGTGAQYFSFAINAQEIISQTGRDSNNNTYSASFYDKAGKTLDSKNFTQPIEFSCDFKISQSKLQNVEFRYFDNTTKTWKRDGISGDGYSFSNGVAKLTWKSSHLSNFQAFATAAFSFSLMPSLYLVLSLIFVINFMQ